MLVESDFDPSERLRYASSQIEAYLDTISLPNKYRQSPVFSEPALARSLDHGLPLLAAIQKYQLAAIPFENLTLHYNPTPSVSIQPDAVHKKFVSTACGRGGRCMENNLLLYTVLHTLGFDVTSVGGRVNEAIQVYAADPSWPGPRYDGWNHRITLVHFSDHEEATRTFLVDTGFGSTVPTRPMELVRDSPTEIVNVAPEQISRLRWTAIPDVVRKEQKMWVYDIKYKKSSGWTPAYCFTETEFLPSDYAMMSFFTSNNKKSWFTSSVVCVKMILGTDDSGEEVIVGDVTLYNSDVKRRVRGKIESAISLETEQQRVEVLRDWFGITLSEAEEDGIKGSAAALS